jgi:hypothetical protein
MGDGRTCEDVRQYLFVLDRDLCSADDQSDPEPVKYLAARQEEEPGKVVVLTLVPTRQAQVPASMQLYKSRSIGRYQRTALPRHDVRAAEHRMHAAVQQLERIGCHATGVITGQRQLVNAVRAQVHGRDYEEVIVVTGKPSSWLVRALRLDPVQRLRVRLGHRLVVFPLGTGAPQPSRVS